MSEFGDLGICLAWVILWCWHTAGFARADCAYRCFGGLIFWVLECTVFGVCRLVFVA